MVGPGPWGHLDPLQPHPGRIGISRWIANPDTVMDHVRVGQPVRLPLLVLGFQRLEVGIAAPGARLVTASAVTDGQSVVREVPRRVPGEFGNVDPANRLTRSDPRRCFASAAI